MFIGYVQYEFWKWEIKKEKEKERRGKEGKERKKKGGKVKRKKLKTEKYHCRACWFNAIKWIFVFIASANECCDAKRTISSVDGVLVDDTRDALDEHFRRNLLSVKRDPIFSIFASLFGKETAIRCESSHTLWKRNNGMMRVSESCRQLKQSCCDRMEKRWRKFVGEKWNKRTGQVRINGNASQMFER